MMIPQPQHRTAIRAKVTLRRAAFLVWSSAVFNSIVFPTTVRLALVLQYLLMGLFNWMGAGWIRMMGKART